MSSCIFFLVASLVKTSFKMEMVEILSDLNDASPIGKELMMIKMAMVIIPFLFC